ncbi:hypothetical protein BC826DRAFT_1181873 [Russula brevipes]|nr:hypothetical protein BC826DRAFT_1181873 [Russula brevipes]
MRPAGRARQVQPDGGECPAGKESKLERAGRARPAQQVRDEVDEEQMRTQQGEAPLTQPRDQGARSGTLCRACRFEIMTQTSLTKLDRYLGLLGGGSNRFVFSRFISAYRSSAWLWNSHRISGGVKRTWSMKLVARPTLLGSLRRLSSSASVVGSPDVEISEPFLPPRTTSHVFREEKLSAYEGGGPRWLVCKPSARREYVEFVSSEVDVAISGEGKGDGGNDGWMGSPILVDKGPATRERRLARGRDDSLRPASTEGVGANQSGGLVYVGVLGLELVNGLTSLRQVVNGTGNPRVFPALPVPIPAKTRTRVDGYGLPV